MSKRRKENLNLVIVGSSGRMGRELIELAKVDSTLKVIGEVSRASDWKKIKKNPDVVIDFSTLVGFKTALKWCEEHHVPLVSGTTGLSSEHRKELKKAARKVPLLYSANMSLGIAVFIKMLESFKALKDWDFQFEEAHHKHKKDRPSGTALLLEEKLKKVIGRGLPPCLSVRGGSIAGIHQVWAMGANEALVLHHTAFDRKVFASGAIAAARWLFDKKQAGLYDLSHLYMDSEN